MHWCCHNANAHKPRPVTVSQVYARGSQQLRLPNQVARLSDCSACGTVDVKAIALAIAFRLRPLKFTYRSILRPASGGCLRRFRTVLKRWRMQSTMNVRTATCAKGNDRNDVIRLDMWFALRYCVFCSNTPDQVIVGRPDGQGICRKWNRSCQKHSGEARIRRDGSQEARSYSQIPCSRCEWPARRYLNPSAARRSWWAMQRELFVGATANKCGVVERKPATSRHSLDPCSSRRSAPLCLWLFWYHTPQSAVMNAQHT